MTEVISVRFKNKGKVYYLDPNGLTVAKGDSVVVETAKCLEFAECVTGNHEVEDTAVHPPLRPVERIATEADMRRFEENRRREQEAMSICRQRIEKHGLEMKLVDVEYNFEGSKILFFFTSEGRVDFRELVKDLAGIFKTRIELRPIGVRDEARMLGGLGICGRPFCCAQFLDDFQPVSIKMAKTQGLSLNPVKISGCCGRLMCCLRYEQPAYEELVKNVPKNGAFVETPDGYGNVTQVNILRQTVRVKLDGAGDDAIRQYDADEVAAIPGGRPRDGSQPPHVLVLKPKKPKETEEADVWEAPELLIRSPAERERRTSLHSRERTSRLKPEGQEPNQTEGNQRSGRSNRSRRKGSGQKAKAQPTQETPVQENKPRSQKNRPNKGQQQPKKPYNAQSGGPAPAEKTQKPKNQKNYHNRRRPQNRSKPKSQEGGKQEG